MYKKLSFDELKGKRILDAAHWTHGDKSWLLRTDAGDYELRIDDDGCGCNDSNAFLSGVSNLGALLGQEIVDVSEEADDYAAEIKLRATNGAECVINITHEQNGYYGYSYELVPIPSRA